MNRSLEHRNARWCVSLLLWIIRRLVLYASLGDLLTRWPAIHGVPLLDGAGRGCRALGELACTKEQLLHLMLLLTDRDEVAP